MLITALLFAVSALPTFLFLRERAVPLSVPDGAYGAFARTWETLRDAGRYRDLMRFLLCILFYQGGVQAVITLGGWCVMGLMAWFADGPAMVCAAANLAGICLG